MSNEIIRKGFLNKIKNSLSNAESVGEIDHAGMRGTAREIFVRDFLEPVLPPYVKIGYGKIGDSRGNLSDQMDVIIYSHQTLPPFLYKSDFGIYPVEACVYAIEVKSILNAEEFRTTIKKFRKLRKFFYLPPAIDNFYKPIGGTISRVIPMLFAFNTDIVKEGKEELRRYKELDSEADTNPAVPVFCVVGKGYWWFKPNEPKEKWIKHLATQDNEEVIDLIGGIANTIPDEVMKKGRPRFGNYIIRERNFEKH